MEVILKEDVVGLGYKDDIVTVKNGYGRNFLIPTGKAIIATEAAKKILAENLRQRAHKIAAIKKEAEEEVRGCPPLHHSPHQRGYRQSLWIRYRS